MSFTIYVLQNVTNTICKLYVIPAYFGAYRFKFGTCRPLRNLKGISLLRYNWGYKQHLVNEFSRFLPVFTEIGTEIELPKDQEQSQPGRKRICDPEKWTTKDAKKFG